MNISKAAVISLLRERGQHARADFIDRELPERVDTDRHSGLLATLRLGPADLAALAEPDDSGSGSAPRRAD